MQIDFRLMEEISEMMQRIPQNVNPAQVAPADLEQLEAMQKALNPLLDALPDRKNRAIMRLRYIQGLPVWVVASMVGIDRTNIFRRVKQAKKDLKTLFPEAFLTPEK